MTELLTCNIISSSPKDDNGHENEKKPVMTDDWNDMVDPELRHVLKSVSLPQITQVWWQHILNGIMHIPYPLPSHIQTRRLYGDDNDGRRNAGRLFWNKQHPQQQHEAAIMWIHGGGRIVGSAFSANDIMICTKLVEMFDVPVLSVNYRTSLTDPFPAALDDVAKSYKSLVEYLTQQQQTITVTDKQQQPKIIVAGESAGGGLAAELCQRLLDESSSSTLPLPVAQLLVYPMLDDRTSTTTSSSCNNNTDNSPQQTSRPPHLVWSDETNRYAWDRYLGRQRHHDDDTPPPPPPKYAAAARRTNLEGLPPAWIMVGSLDLFRDECYDYAYRLALDGHVTTRYVEVVGGFHAMFGMGRDTKLVGRSWDDMYDFGRQYLAIKEGKEAEH